jgi:TolB-like protein
VIRRLRGATLLLTASLLCALAACNKNIDTKFEDQMNDTIRGLPLIGNDTGLNVHAVRSIKQVIIHKIAVMPLVDSPDQIDKALPAGSSESVTAQLYAQATVVGGWQVVPQDDVGDALQQMPPTTIANMDANAIALGKKLAAGGVLYGTVNKYRERVGFEYSAQAPAAVAFTLSFVDEHSGQVVWSAKYAREQKALAENVFDLPTFIQNKGRWVRAHDIAQEGVDAALANLYSKLTIQPVVQGQ